MIGLIEKLYMTRLLLSFLLLTSFYSTGQVLNGTIFDEEGYEIPFARIGIAKSTYATLANGEGKYQLQLEPGTHILEITSSAYETVIDTLTIVQGTQTKDYILSIYGKMLEEAVITKRSRRDLAREIMEKVIDQRKDWEKTMEDYDCNLYAFSSIELEVTDSLDRDSVISKKKMNIAELYTHSFLKNGNLYKDSILGNLDLSEKSQNSASVSVQISSLDENLQPQNAPDTNPYLFVSGLQTADINLFKNTTLLSTIFLFSTDLSLTIPGAKSIK